MMLGVGISAAIAWWANAPATAHMQDGLNRTKASWEGHAGADLPLLSDEGLVVAVNIARKPVKRCYYRESALPAFRERIVVVEFWVEVVGGRGTLFGGKVPSPDSISESFDQCIRDELALVSFQTILPAGRQKVTFPYAFEMETNDEKVPDAPALERP